MIMVTDKITKNRYYVRQESVSHVEWAAHIRCWYVHALLNGQMTMVPVTRSDALIIIGLID